jgi:hypothetical protein
MLNQALCARARNAAHGFNRETAEAVQAQWEAAQRQKMTVMELVDFLLQCHRSAPFLNFNGNVFGEIARQILATALLGMAIPRVEAACSLAAHCVAGVLDRDEALKGISALLSVDVLEPGDKVTTLQMTMKGEVTRVLPDGRVAWLPAGRKVELLAAPETLIKLG